MGARFKWSVALLVLLVAPQTRAALSVQVVHTDSGHEVKAVDPSGTVYGLSTSDSSARIYASTDGARSWIYRGRHPAGGSFKRMTSLSDGTLLADTQTSAGFALSRSADGGRTWQDVLFLGDRQLLSPRSIEQWGDEVFLVEYQTVTTASTPIRLWVSTDLGVSWSLRYTFEGHRHAHAVRGDPYTGDIWVFMGDSTAQSAILRSTDGGRRWTQVIEGQSSLACDGVFTPEGLVYGQDISFLPWRPKIVRVTREGQLTELAALPAPGYSMLQTAGGGFLLGTTWESNGDIYLPGEERAHLFGSVDGDVWTDLLGYERVSASEYARADVFWQLPSGEVILQLRNVAQTGAGHGYQLLKVSGAGSTQPPPPDTGGAATFADDFDACTAETNLGARWDISGVFYCRAGRARGEQADAVALARTGDLPDVSVQARVVLAGSTRSGVVVRGSSAGYYAARLVEGEGVELVRVRGNSMDVLARSSRAVRQLEGYRLSLSSRGRAPVTLEVRLEGERVVSFSDASSLALVTGRAGLISGSLARTQYDDFLIAGEGQTGPTPPDPTPPPVPVPPAASFADNFDSCDTSSGIGADWDSDGRWYCSAGRARGEHARGLARVRALLPADLAVQARIQQTGVASDSGVVARAQGDSYYAARLVASGRVELLRVDHGQETMLASVSKSLGNSSYKLRLEVSGQTPVQLSVTLDGIAIATATDASMSRRLAGSAGLLSGSSARTQFDDFVAQAP